MLRASRRASTIEAFDRRGLLRDISDLIAEEHLSIEGVTSHTDPRDRIARFEVRLTVHDASELSRLQRRLARIPNVVAVKRLRAGNGVRAARAAAGSLAVQRVDGALVGVERRFVHGFGQRRMRMDRALQILAAGAGIPAPARPRRCSSPAIGPMMCTPRIRSLSASATIFAKPAAGFHRACAAAGA